MYYFGYILFGLCVTRADSTNPGCRTTSLIANGYIANRFTHYGYTARVVCDPGYRPNRTLTDGGVRCLPNGELEAVQCEPFAAATDILNRAV
ncbi:hypothetical protein DPMN_129523 [Dreissena polymorpha]|uniref:Sushi domain-containing protein n=1 Tax=Dreissena polymorpha TaxID=45954 RepID=A0A9D4JXF7_DREPO|nr:hypothetical protein DPMN_129523 [Dreissena polymorpha]